ncbi:MAG: acyl carrier protein [Candidatus Azotimanducaceae bacterium]|jgi:acyl carrier protein
MSQIDRDEFQRLVHDLVNREGINLERKGRITESMSLEDLGLDSIRRAHFLMGLESALGDRYNQGTKVFIDDNSFELVSTLGDVRALIDRTLADL